MPRAQVKEKQPSAAEVVKWCANNLGIDFDTDPQTPAWKRVSVEAAKLNRIVNAKNATVTMADLLLTAKWCARHRVVITSPAGLVYHVDKARRDAAPEPEMTDLDVALGAAIASEMRRRDDGDPEAGQWLRRLQRAIGPYREQTLTDWREARRG